VSTPTSGRIVDGVHILPLRVYYEDTDAAGIVYYANWLRFLERGRTEFIRALGVDQQALHRDEGVAFVVRALAIEYVKPALMDDLVVVETQVETLKGPVMQLAQAIRRGDEVLTTAEVTVVAVKAGRPVRLPAALRAVIAAAG